MNPQHTIAEGSLTIEVYGGYREIGGNCIVIKDKDRKVVLDNGIRFSIIKRYYRGRIQPLGLNELRGIGAIPPLEVFEDADALYISHFHLDHLGLLGTLPPGTKVYVPSISILEIIEDWYESAPTWLAELPHKLHINIAEMTPYDEDGLGVIPVPVSHSSYPSYALIYRGSDKTVFYSGDLRVNGPLGPQLNTLLNIEKTVNTMSIDIGLVEGTNIGCIETPIGPEEFKGMFNNILMESGLVVVSVDPLDFEMMTALSELAVLSGRNLVIASPRLVDILPQWLESFKPPTGLELAVSAELEKPALLPVKYTSVQEEVFSEPSNYIVVQEPLGFLDMLRQMRLWRKELPPGITAILTNPEPLEAEVEVEEETLAYWLYSLGVQVYRIRLSGHYYPHQLKTLIETIRPKKLIPIHTRHPSLVVKLANTQ